MRRIYLESHRLVVERNIIESECQDSEDHASTLNRSRGFLEVSVIFLYQSFYLGN